MPRFKRHTYVGLLGCVIHPLAPRGEFLQPCNMFYAEFCNVYFITLSITLSTYYGQKVVRDPHNRSTESWRLRPSSLVKTKFFFIQLSPSAACSTPYASTSLPSTLCTSAGTAWPLPSNQTPSRFLPTPHTQRTCTTPYSGC